MEIEVPDGKYISTLIIEEVVAGNNSFFIKVHKTKPIIVHKIKDIFVHGVDHQAQFLAEGGHRIDQFGKGHGGLFDIGHHGHGKILIHNVLGNIENIDIVFQAFVGYMSDDADTVGAHNGNNCFHFYISFRNLW